MEYNVYIDESGDEGIHRGSEWFILTAVIVPKEYDLNLSNKVVTIKEMLGLDRKSQLHWNKLNAEQRIKVIYSLIAENFKIIHVAINTFEIEKLKALGYDISKNDNYKKFLSQGIIKEKDGFVAINKNYFGVSNEIIVKLFP